ncbi:cupin domain-containing protein [Pseudomonas sp. NPDC086278]|uniref:cupin domain-containing protein n=1 Tax=Pseudomonas sp. NPDC086278 TaxID=3390646 RepID=UPI003D00D66F
MSRFNPRNTTGLLGITLAALIAFGAVAQAQEAVNPAKNWQAGLHRTDLVRQELDVAKGEVIQVRVDFDAGVASPKHSHPGVEVAYVISGTFEYQLEGRAAVTLNAGDSLYIPAGTAHVAKNIGDGKGSELATYIVNKDSPLVVLEK